MDNFDIDVYRFHNFRRRLLLLALLCLRFYKMLNRHQSLYIDVIICICQTLVASSRVLVQPATALAWPRLNWLLRDCVTRGWSALGATGSGSVQVTTGQCSPGGRGVGGTHCCPAQWLMPSYLMRCHPNMQYFTISQAATLTYATLAFSDAGAEGNEHIMFSYLH